VSLFFSVEKQSTKQKIVTLVPNNILCSENGVEIPDFALMKDTSQGAGRVDIVFVLDVTGSMSGMIDAVKIISLNLPTALWRGTCCSDSVW